MKANGRLRPGSWTYFGIGGIFDEVINQPLLLISVSSINRNVYVTKIIEVNVRVVRGSLAEEAKTSGGLLLSKLLIFRLDDAVPADIVAVRRATTDSTAVGALLLARSFGEHHRGDD